MKKNYFFISFLIAIVTLVACTNDDVEDVPYPTGVIKFEYQKSTLINGLSKSIDTAISFTSML
jgi:major membrane immunogen (membrane-anchored lipoprotein)